MYACTVALTLLSAALAFPIPDHRGWAQQRIGLHQLPMQGPRPLKKHRAAYPSPRFRLLERPWAADGCRIDYRMGPGTAP